ncbi:disulfide-isomerase [Zopfochytrium polystomum]|nr:disulfide-isomerase [Zopfochytrium polystomum]
MRGPLFALAGAIIALTSARRVVAEDAAASTPSTPSDVVVLTKDTFADFIKDDLSLVEFYAPWCGHCKALAPEYEVAATELLKEKIKIAKVDCTAETDVCNGQDVRGYPTLKVFRKGTAAEYKGARKADGIISYMKKQALPAVTELKADDIEKFKTTDKVVVIGYFSDQISKKYKAFVEVANSLRDDYVFGFTNDNVKGITAPSVVLYKTFDEGETKFDGKYNAETLTSFIKVSATPVMDDISPENYGAYMSSGLPLAFLFVRDEADRKAVGPAVEAVAKSVKGKMSFVYIDTGKFGSHAKSLNLKEGVWPAFAIQETKDMLKFPFDQEKDITQEAIAAFVSDYLDGKLQPSLKSEPIPASNDGPVKVVVHDNFKDIVLDSKKDVFLEIYAPWCGHCKALAPVWEELGKTLSGDNDSVIVAKMDGTENDLPVGVKFQVQGFPTLKLFLAESNEVVDYTGDRTLEALFAFLKEKATNKDKIKATIASSPDDEDDEDEDDEDDDEEESSGHDEL